MSTFNPSYQLGYDVINPSFFLTFSPRPFIRTNTYNNSRNIKIQVNKFFRTSPEAPKNCSVGNQTINLLLVYDRHQIQGLGPKPILKRKLALNLGPISKLFNQYFKKLQNFKLRKYFPSMKILNWELILEKLSTYHKTNDFLQGLLQTTWWHYIKRPIHYCCTVTRFLIQA